MARYDIEAPTYTKTGRDLRTFVNRLLKQKGVETSFYIESEETRRHSGYSRFRVIFNPYFEDHCKAAQVDPADDIGEVICTYFRKNRRDFGRTVGYHYVGFNRAYRDWTPYNEIECIW